jgi:hypothetical protein
MEPKFIENEKIVSSDGALIGEPSGAEWPCRLESCRGVRITTRWPGGRISHPCSKGLVDNGDGNLRIG